MPPIALDADFRAWPGDETDEELESLVTTQRKNITAPADWWAVWKSEADAEGLTLSEWIGQRVNATLPKKTAKQLSDRPPAHRPKINPEKGVDCS